MIRNPARNRFIIYSAGILTVFLSLLFFASAQENSSSIIIYHTNDMHGNVNSIFNGGTTTQIGLDLIKSVKDSTPNSILIDAGDALQGKPFGSYSKGKDIIEMMNAVGYDGMALGNHEFDYGSDSVKECVQAANFPIVSANIMKSGKLFLQNINGSNGANFIKEVNGKRIGFFGITTEETNRTTIPSNLQGITFLDEVETARNEVKKLKSQKVDLIVGVMHVGIDASSKTTSHDIAKKVPGIDIIIDGHSHTRTTDTVGNTVISQTGTNVISLGKIEINFNGSKPNINAATIPASEVGNLFIPNQDISRMYDDKYSKIKPLQERVIGKTSTSLYGGTYNGKNICRYTETNLGDLICDAIIFSGKSLIKDTNLYEIPVVAFENGGAVRSSIGSGYVTMEDITNVLPLDNRLSAQVITSQQLYYILERCVGKLTIPQNPDEPFSGPFGGFPQIGGMKIHIDLSEKPYDYEKLSGGNRIREVILLDDNGNEKQVILRNDNKTQILFLCNDYTIYEFPPVKEHHIELKGDYLSDVLAEYIQKLTFENDGIFSYPLSYNRVIIDNIENLFNNFDSIITVKDDNGILPGIDVNITIDEKSKKSLTTDESGQVTIESLHSGGHNITLEYKGLKTDSYINNQVGLNNSNILLSDSSDRNISCVSNIIGQIPYIITIDSEDIVNFARLSYDNLDNSNKGKIMNFSKLEKSEEKLSQIKNSDSIYDVSPLEQYKSTVIALSSFLILSGATIAWLLIKKQKINR